MKNYRSELNKLEQRVMSFSKKLPELTKELRERKERATLKLRNPKAAGRREGV